MSGPLNKTPNEYEQTLSHEFREKCPKAVLAAIAVSYASAGGGYLENAQDNIVREWLTLHENGIVPQKPPAKFVAALPKEDA